MTGCTLSTGSQEEILALLKDNQVFEQNWDYVDVYNDVESNTINFVYVNPMNAYNVVSIPNSEQDKYAISVNTNVVLEYKGDSYVGFDEPETTTNWEVTKSDDDDLQIAKVDN